MLGMELLVIDVPICLMGVCKVVCLGVISNMFYYYLHVSYGTTRDGCPYTHIPYGHWMTTLLQSICQGGTVPLLSISLSPRDRIAKC